MPVQIQLRRGDSEEWTSIDPILAEGEIGTELDTGKWKVGDGTSKWSELEYSTGPSGPVGPTGPEGPRRPSGPSGPS
jgi:hypothetical protein